MLAVYVRTFNLSKTHILAIINSLHTRLAPSRGLRHTYRAILREHGANVARDAVSMLFFASFMQFSLLCVSVQKAKHTIYRLAAIKYLFR
eukprot:SAG11_NODE_1370_length_5096_cov_2.366620_2_plen_90_part_00